MLSAELQLSTRAAKSGVISNNSLDIIRTYLHIHAATKSSSQGYPEGIPLVTGIVTEMRPRIKDGAGGAAKEAESDDADNDGVDELHFAGILLSYIPKAKRLMDWGESTEEQKKVRRNRLEAIVNGLHERGVACGGREDGSWKHINSYSVVIDADDELWLTMSRAVLQANESPAAFEKHARMDRGAVEELFPVAT